MYSEYKTSWMSMCYFRSRQWRKQLSIVVLHRVIELKDKDWKIKMLSIKHNLFDPILGWRMVDDYSWHKLT